MEITLCFQQSLTSSRPLGGTEPHLFLPSPRGDADGPHFVQVATATVSSLVPQPCPVQETFSCGTLSSSLLLPSLKPLFLSAPQALEGSDPSSCPALHHIFLGLGPLMNLCVITTNSYNRQTNKTTASENLSSEDSFSFKHCKQLISQPGVRCLCWKRTYFDSAS